MITISTIRLETYADADFPSVSGDAFPSRGMPDIGAFDLEEVAEETCPGRTAIALKTIVLSNIQRAFEQHVIRANVFVAANFALSGISGDVAVSGRILEDDGMIDDDSAVAATGTLGAFEAGKFGLEDIADDDPMYGGIAFEIFADDDYDMVGTFLYDKVVQEVCALPRGLRSGFVYYRKPFYPLSRG